MSLIPDCFYRISVKALILNEERTKFLITKEENGWWELPGGGLDWGVSPQVDLAREIKEEMGLKIISVNDNPSYFLTDIQNRTKVHIANVLYETTVEDLNFTPSDECIEIAFVSKEDIDKYQVFSNVKILAEMFDPKKH